MLELMRKHAKNWLMKFLLGMIIVVFIFYFGSRTGKEKTATVAVVDGKEIALSEVQKEYSDIAEFYRQQYGGSLSEELLKGLDLKQKALDSLIQQAIIMQKARELNIATTDEEVRSHIMAYPAFQRNGAFNENVYQRMLRMNRMTPEEFEAAQKRIISTAKLQRLIQDGVKVSDQEVLDFFRFQNEQINFNYLLFKPENFKSSISPSRKDLETYLKEHGAEFRVPEQMQMNAVFFPGRDFANTANITNADISDYYDRNQSKYAKKGDKAPPLKDVRNQIVSELAQINGMSAAAEQAKKVHDTIYQEENFDSYVAQHKLRTVTTDFFPMNNIPLPFSKIPGFDQAVMTLKKGEISKVFSDDDGYFFIRVVDRKPSYVPELKDIEQNVAKRYTEMEARNRCKKAADAALASLNQGASLVQVAQANRVPVEESGFFKPGAAIPKLGNNPQLSTALYQLSERTPFPAQPIETSDGYAVIRFKERGKIDMAGYEAGKEDLKQLLLTMKRNEYFATWLENTKASMIKEGKLKIKKETKDL